VTSVAKPQLGFGTLVVATSTVLVLSLTSLVDASPTWLILVVLALAAFGMVLWTTDPKRTLFSLFLFTLPITISKALTARASAYSPALELFLSDLAFLPLASLWLFDKFATGKVATHWSDLHWIATCNILWLAISALSSIDAIAFFVLVNNLKYWFYFVVIADLARDPRYLKSGLIALACGLGCQLFMAMLQVVTGSDLQIRGAKNTDLGRLLIFEQAGGVHVRRPSGFLAHPNVFADYLTFVLPPLIAFLLLGRTVLGNLVWSICAILGFGAFAALVLALSRGGWIAFGFALLFVFGVGLRAGLVRKAHVAALIAAVVLGAAALAAFFPAAIYRAILSDNQSSHARVAMMQQAALVIMHHPMIGVGLGGYNKAAQNEIPSSWSTLLPAFRDTLLKGVVHNKYLLTVAETGTVGLTLFLLFIGGHIILPFRNIGWTGPEQFALVLGLSGAVVAQAVFYLFDHFSYDVRLGVLYVCAGLTAGIIGPRASLITHPDPADGSHECLGGARPAELR
jgi:O-antigen ligase